MGILVYSWYEADLPMLARETKASQLTKKGDILTSHRTEKQRETA
jgi:hypothetical protein